MKEEIRVKKLKNQIRKNGFLYTLVERTDEKAIYAQENYAFEVFKVKLSKPHPKAQNDLDNYDLVEKFPGDEDFGKSAWTFRTLEAAEKRYATL